MTIADAERFIDSYCIDPPPAGAAERLRAAAASGLDLDTETNQDAIDDVIYGREENTRVDETRRMYARAAADGQPSLAQRARHRRMVMWDGTCDCGAECAT